MPGVLTDEELPAVEVLVVVVAAETPTTVITPSPAPTAESDEHIGERLHSLTRFRKGRRRSVTVDARQEIHNAAPTTVPSAQA